MVPFKNQFEHRLDLTQMRGNVHEADFLSQRLFGALPRHLKPQEQTAKAEFEALFPGTQRSPGALPGGSTRHICPGVTPGCLCFVF